MPHIRRLLSLVLVVFLSARADADWPTWQHDNQRTGATQQSLDVESLQLAWVWRSAAPPDPAWAGPAKWDAYAYHRNLPSMRNYDPVFHVITVGESVWFGSSADDSLYCLDANDGSQRWVRTVDGPIRLAPSYAEGRIYFGSDDGYARCLDAGDGKVIWEVPAGEPGRRILNNGRLIPLQPCRTGVVVADGTAYFAGALLPWEDSWLCAVDAETGKVTGDRHFRKKLPGRTMEGAPALSSKFLILPQGRVAPQVFDRATGKDLGPMVKSGGGSVVVVTLDDAVMHGPATDTRRGGFRQSNTATREVVAGLGRGNALVVDGDTSWMLTDDQIIASSLTRRAVLWKTPCDCPYTMTKAGDVLFVGGADRIAAHSALDGARLWSHKVEGTVYGLAVASGRLLASSDRGVIHCFTSKPTPATSPQLVDLDASRPGLVNDDEQSKPLETLAPVRDDHLIGHWAFQQSAAATDGGYKIAALTGKDLQLSHRPQLSRVGNHLALELDGTQQTVQIAPDFRQAAVPDEAFSAEVWVRLDATAAWGSFIGAIQDNGSFERGWLLGYREDKYCLAVAAADGPQRLTYMTAKSPAALRQWQHVVGTYDGKTMTLFVDGKPVATSDQQSGPILYPDHAWFEIGAYHDKDEFFRMRGALHEVQLYNRCLTSTEVSQHYEASRARFPEKADEVKPASGPWLQFVDRETAIVRWTTHQPQPTSLRYGPSEDLRWTVTDASPKTEHEVRLENLGRRRIYQYQMTLQQQPTSLSPVYECDTFFNYTTASTADRADRVTAAPDDAQQLLNLLPHRAGIGLVLGDIDMAVLRSLANGGSLRWMVLRDDAAKVRQMRETLLSEGIYGSRVTVHAIEDLAELPVVTGWANLVVGYRPENGAQVDAWTRMAQPDGGVIVLVEPGADVDTSRFDEVAQRPRWYRRIRPPFPGTGDWSHLYGRPDNSAFAGEQLGGAKSADDLEVHWVGRPGPRYQADRSGRKPSPLATGGRLFLQGLHRIIALDSYNGTILWSLEIPDLERFNMPRDCSNWCANRDHLFIAVRHECWKIHAATGKVVDRWMGQPSGQMDWGFLATQGRHLFGSEVKPGSSWTSFWGGGDAGWYDARSGAVTYPICSDTLFCKEVETGHTVWQRKQGVVLNSTITLNDSTLFFVESRDPEIIAAESRRIGDPRLWKNLYLVAVDSATGYQRWEQKLAPTSPQVIYYLAHGGDQLTLVSSSNAEYQIESRSATDGRKRWSQTAAWPGGKGDHGKAMSRPAIVGDKLFVRPAVFSIQDGTKLPATMPGGGCGTYACTTHALFFRASTVTMWDPQTAGTSTWSRLRPDCWLSTIPAGGMLLSPEGGGGCSCGTWMETSIGFMPKMLAR